MNQSCTLYTENWQVNQGSRADKLYSIHYTVYISHDTVYNVKRTYNILHYTLYSVLYTLCTLQCNINTPHS